MSQKIIENVAARGGPILKWIGPSSVRSGFGISEPVTVGQWRELLADADVAPSLTDREQAQFFGSLANRSLSDPVVRPPYYALQAFFRRLNYRERDLGRLGGTWGYCLPTLAVLDDAIGLRSRTPEICLLPCWPGYELILWPDSPPGPYARLSDTPGDFGFRLFCHQDAREW